ncbi:MAG: polysaccharide biosynthesis tyrosine autokinase [Pseudomonadota bacterium]|nr:polysaccharide biosynthesis tyrosine autokinase [Pseudomonadota bacterium]
MSRQPHDAGHSGHLPIALETRRPMLVANDPHRAISLDLRAPEPEATNDDMDLRAYWRILLKRRWTVLGAWLIVLVTVLVGTLLTTPIYRAAAILQIERDTIKVVDVGSMTPLEGAGDRDFYQTQYELLKSRSLAERVVNQMGLAASGELERLKPRTMWGRLSALFSENGATRTAPVASTSGAAPQSAPSDDRQRALVNLFKEGLSIEPVRNSRLVRINYDSPDRAFSQRAANAVAETFIASNLERRFDSSSYAKGYLEERLQEFRLKLEESERNLVSFAQREQIVSVGEDSSSLSEQSLASLNGAVDKAREERIRTESRWRQAQASRGLVLYADVGSSSIIQSLQESRGKLMAEYQDKLRMYKPEYPLMLQLKGQISEIGRQTVDEIANIKAAIQADYLGAQDQERLLNEQMAAVKVEVLDLQNRSIQYNIYKREVDTNRQLYDGLLQRYKEVGVAGGVSTNNISIVDRAIPGSKFKPSVKGNLVIGALIGLLLGILLALAFEYLDDTLKAPEDIERHLGVPVLGVIPMLKKITPQEAWQDQRSAFSEAYRSVRTALQFSTATGSPKSLLVTSATPSEGKSTTALTLARNFAQMGTRVLLIDADLRNPTLHRTLGIENTKGLSNLLAGAVRPSDVIITTGDRGLMVMTSGPLPPNPAELLAGSKMLSLLTVAGVKFDKIIIDGPPVLGLADAPILANVARATLLVVEAGETRVSVARNAIKRLQAARAFVVGGILTKFESRQSGYGYGYGDYNYYTYRGKGVPRLERQ